MIMSLSLPKVIHGFKTALACVIGYLLYLFTPLPQAQWIIITILVVMSAQTTVGGILIKAKMRMLGTILGATASVLIIILSKGDSTGIGIGLFFSIMIFTYIASRPGDVNYVGTLGSVTVAIILLNNEISLTMAGERFIEITLGIVLSFLVSYFVFPIRAHTLFINNLAETINQLCRHFEHSSFPDDDEKMLGIFFQQKRLIYETGLELGKARKDKPVFKKVFDIERRIYRAINMMLYTKRGMDEESANLYIKNLRAPLSECFQALSSSAKTGILQPVQIGGDLDRLHQKVTEEIKEMSPTDEHQYAFLFSLKFLISELKNLNEGITKINYLKKSKII
jgi:uncharacterized membrane protein YgaE (UPF0421/DUF939 family)